MSIIEEFSAIATAIAASGHDDDLLRPMVWARACERVLPIDGASISLNDGLMRMPLGASNNDASAAEMLQFTLGDGPCLETHRTGQPLHASLAEMQHRWPVFCAAFIHDTPYRSAASIPLLAADMMIGALDLYSRNPDGVDDTITERAYGIALYVVRQMLQYDATAEAWDDPSAEPTAAVAWLNSPPARRRRAGWIAVGMLRAANHLDASEALDVMRGYAWTHDLSVDRVAEKLVDTTLSTEALMRGTPS